MESVVESINKFISWLHENIFERMHPCMNYLFTSDNFENKYEYFISYGIRFTNYVKVKKWKKNLVTCRVATEQSDFKEQIR